MATLNFTSRHSVGHIVWPVVVILLWHVKSAVSNHSKKKSINHTEGFSSQKGFSLFFHLSFCFSSAYQIVYPKIFLMTIDPARQIPVSYFEGLYTFRIRSKNKIRVIWKHNLLFERKQFPPGFINNYCGCIAWEISE